MNKLNMAYPLYDRQSHESEAMREELCKAKTELSQIRMELTHSSTQKDKISSQVMLFTNKTFHFDSDVDEDHLRITGILYPIFAVFV